MDLKHEVAYRGVLPGAVKAEPGVSHNGHQANGHVRDWMAGGAGAGSPSPGPPVQPQPNGYSSPLSSGSYGPYSPNGKIGTPIVTDNEYWWGGHYPGEECNNKCGGMFYNGYLVNNDCEVKSFFICEHQGENHVGKINMDQQSSALVPEVVTPEP